MKPSDVVPRFVMGLKNPRAFSLSAANHGVIATEVSSSALAG
jgi:hypothetical protein